MRSFSTALAVESFVSFVPPACFGPGRVAMGLWGCVASKRPINGKKPGTWDGPWRPQYPWEPNCGESSKVAIAETEANGSLDISFRSGRSPRAVP